jgi:hypothetical protein
MGSIQRSEESQMKANKNIFVAVDDSEASDRAVTYVAQMVDGRREFHILLFFSSFMSLHRCHHSS